MEPTTQTSEETLSTKKQTITLPQAILSGAVIIAVALLIAFGPRATTQKQRTTSIRPETPAAVDAKVANVRPDDHVRGDMSKAEVAIIEYADSDCSFCQRFHPTMLQLMDEYKGKLIWIYRLFPLTSLHPNAYTEAEALECVAELGGADAFNTYLDTITNVTLNPDPKSNAALVTFATAQGIDAGLFKACISNPKTAAPIDATIAEAQSIGARGTPFSIVVNLKTGKQVIVPGAYPIEDVRKDIEEVLR